jgi:hypothetical protein
MINRMIDTPAAQRVSRAAVAKQVEALVAQLNPTVSVERRSDERVAVPVLFRLTPLDERRRPVECEAVTVVGKNVSPRGLSFYHNQALPYRRALISVQHPTCDVFSAEIDISWCRFTTAGWYESGGRLVAAASVEAIRPANGSLS